MVCPLTYAPSPFRTPLTGKTVVKPLQVFPLVCPVVRSCMIGLREDELGDPGAALDLDLVVDLQQPLAATLVAGVPYCRVEHTGVAHERGAWIDEPDVFLRNPDRLTVSRDVPPWRERVRPGVVRPGRLALPALADRLVIAGDPPRLNLLEDAPEGQVNAVWLDLIVVDRVNPFGDEGS